MKFFQKKAGILIGILCLAALAALVWYCLTNNPGQKEPEGTLVQIRNAVIREVPA